MNNIVESNDGSVSADEREGGGFLIKIKLKIYRAQKREEKALPEEKKEGQGRKKQDKNEGQGRKINKTAPNILYIFGA